MNKSKAIKNSECYYELNMLSLLVKMNLLTEEELETLHSYIQRMKDNITNTKPAR